MNAYAFNVTPLNGYETQFGAGNAAIVLSGMAAVGAAQQASSSAVIRVVGAGQADAGAARFADGTATITLGATADGLLPILARGAGLIALGGKQGLPDTTPVPTVYYRAPLIRRVDTFADIRLIRVPSDPYMGRRVIKADGEPRQIRVPADATTQGGQA